MTPNEIKAEFSRHSDTEPIMKAFQAWLQLMFDDAADLACAPLELPHLEHRRAGQLTQAKYALQVFEGVLDEAEKARKAADQAKH